MFSLATYQKSDLKDVVLLVDRNIEERYSPTIYDELSANWLQGFVLCKEDEDLKGLIFALSTPEGYGRIIIFCVEPGYRNRGLGSSLLKELEERAKANGFNVLRLEVRIENHNAIEFYKKRGFTITKTLKEFYNDDGDAFNMMKFL
jgi:ribosomal-protein-alanine N-acetyltransferase